MAEHDTDEIPDRARTKLIRIEFGLIDLIMIRSLRRIWTGLQLDLVLASPRYANTGNALTTFMHAISLTLLALTIIGLYESSNAQDWRPLALRAALDFT